MKKISILIAALCLSIIPLTQASASTRLRVGSYNLRMHYIDKGDNDWSVRRARVMQSIKDNKFDIFGVEEVSEEVQEELRKEFSDKYDFLFTGPYSQDGIGGKAHGIIWRKDKIKMLEFHRFWPSETPDSCCINDNWTRKVKGKMKTSYFKRGATCGMFETTKGEKFFFMCSHAALSQEDNAKYAHVYIDREKMYNPEGYPSFFVGDLNTRPTTASSELWRSYWTDSALCGKKEPTATFNGFDPKIDITTDSRRIDYIYFRGKVKMKKYFCNTKLYDGKFASDHYPIRADVVVKK